MCTKKVIPSFVAWTEAEAWLAVGCAAFSEGPVVPGPELVEHWLLSVANNRHAC